MDSLSIPTNLLPEGIIKPAAFIADKYLDLPDYGIDTGDLVIVDSGIKFVKGELSAFHTKEGAGYQHFCKSVMVIKY